MSNALRFFRGPARARGARAAALAAAAAAAGLLMAGCGDSPGGEGRRAAPAEFAGIWRGESGSMEGATLVLTASQWALAGKGFRWHYGGGPLATADGRVAMLYLGAEPSSGAPVIGGGSGSDGGNGSDGGSTGGGNGGPVIMARSPACAPPQEAEPARGARSPGSLRIATGFFDPPDFFMARITEANPHHEGVSVFHPADVSYPGFAGLWAGTVTGGYASFAATLAIVGDNWVFHAPAIGDVSAGRFELSPPDESGVIHSKVFEFSGTLEDYRKIGAGAIDSAGNLITMDIDEGPWLGEPRMAGEFRRLNP